MNTFASDKQFLQDMLKEIESGSIQIPEFQRDWRWDDDHIQSVIASVSQSFPIGAVMMLKNGGPVRFATRPIEGTKPEIKRVKPETLILDGQQRLTALFQSLMSGQVVNTLDNKNNKTQRRYYLDMNQCVTDGTDWEEAVISVTEQNRLSLQQEYTNDLFPVSLIFDADQWERNYLKRWNNQDDKWALYKQFDSKIIKCFEGYQVPVITLDKQTSREAVCLIFGKVNSQGVALTVFELLTASFAADKFNLRKDWAYRKKRLRKHQALEKLDDVNFLQALMLVVTKNRRTAVSCKRKDILSLESGDYKEWADRIEKGFEKASYFLDEQKIGNAQYLPYQTQVVPLAAILTELDDTITETPETRKKLANWYWCGIFGEMYGGTTDTRLANDFSEMIAWIRGKTSNRPRTIQDANFHENRLEMLRTRRSAACKGVYALLILNECRDLLTDEAIRSHILSNDKIEIHHIFPRAWCKTQGINQKYSDSIINKTILKESTNKRIGGIAPSAYLHRIQEEPWINQSTTDEILKSHLICPRTLRGDNFRDFFETRKEALLEAIEKAMGKKVIREGDDPPEA